MRNYWLKLKRQKDHLKRQDAKIDEIAKYVSRYIRGKKKNGT